MLAAKVPVVGDHKPRPKSTRKPLQPKNIQSHPPTEFAKPKQNKLEPTKPSLAAANKPASASPSATPAKIETFEASLADELTAIKQRLQRLRIEKDNTEMVLKEKDSFLDRKMAEIDRRGEVQMMLEIEVDRLYRLNQLHSQAMARFSPIRSLREKERSKVVSESESKEMKTEDKEANVDETLSEESNSVTSST